jgi:GT2 family glycosyltransferase
MEPSAPQTPPRISVIIVSYNVRDLLLACIASIPAESTEIIVVDNQSADGTVAAVRAHASHVRVIDNDENVGFARANNQALRWQRWLAPSRPIPPSASPGLRS